MNTEKLSQEEREEIARQFTVWLQHPYTQRVIKKLRDDAISGYKMAANNPRNEAIVEVLVSGRMCDLVADMMTKPLMD